MRSWLAQVTKIVVGQYGAYLLAQANLLGDLQEGATELAAFLSGAFSEWFAVRHDKREGQHGASDARNNPLALLSA